jgi:hypothetical protein
LTNPYDPATGQGTLGGNLTRHISIPAAIAFLPKPLNRFMGAGSAGIAITISTRTNFQSDDKPA